MNITSRLAFGPFFFAAAKAPHVIGRRSIVATASPTPTPEPTPKSTPNPKKRQTWIDFASVLSAVEEKKLAE